MHINCHQNCIKIFDVRISLINQLQYNIHCEKMPSIIMKIRGECMNEELRTWDKVKCNLLNVEISINYNGNIHLFQYCLKILQNQEKFSLIYFIRHIIHTYIIWWYGYMCIFLDICVDLSLICICMSIYVDQQWVNSLMLSC